MNVMGYKVSKARQEAQASGEWGMVHAAGIVNTWIALKNSPERLKELFEYEISNAHGFNDAPRLEAFIELRTMLGI